MWFQHDVALARFIADVRNALDTAYLGRWIGQGVLVNKLAAYSAGTLLPRLLTLGTYEESCLPQALSTATRLWFRGLQT
ncbi:hypothetical protein TNCV_3560171 [Trichonephila clavipes]|uniref:Uncharacterized protein n=1 Tax=Trichonephila clavipes TaxID=2585209 RepID=A0A8X7BJB0_TRICX|nr:hypothetical protein TNCV_3560171 [Trichonephila clavipes]